MGHLAFSPDGRQLGAWLSHWNGRSDFWLIPWPSGEPVLALSLQQDAAAFNWMPDGRRILFGARMAGTTGADLHVADLESRRVFPLTKTSTEAVHPAVTWDGTRIAFTASNHDFDLVEMTLDGAPPKTVLATSRSETHASWSPAGGQYAFVTDRTGSPQIWIKSKGDGWQRPLITEADFANFWVASFEDTTFSADGQRIAYTVTGSKGHALYVSNVMGGPPLRLLTDNNDQRAPAWSPDGAWIAFVENASGRWSLAKVASGGTDKAVRIRSLPGPCDPQWSPKGDWITCVTEEGLALISPDGSSTRPISRQNWLLQGWNKDGSAIYGVVQLPNRHRALAVIDVAKPTERIVTELPMAAATAIQGFSLSPEGDRFLTAVGRPRADIWVLEGFERPSMWKTLLGRMSH
jgi:TolB protein